MKKIMLFFASKLFKLSVKAAGSPSYRGMFETAVPSVLKKIYNSINNDS